MQKLIDASGKVTYGSIDELVKFNPQDFKLRNFFGKEVTGFRKRIAFNTFNFLSIISDNCIVGLATVNLGYISSLFGFIYRFSDGDYFESRRMLLPSRIRIPANPDSSTIEYHDKKIKYLVRKSHQKNRLDIDCSFGDNLIISGTFKYGLKNKPLRVVNPSCGDPYRFTFTEKCPLFFPENISVQFNGQEMISDPKHTTGLYDWSGGYLNRNTNWFWSAFSGITENEKRLGANFAALTNESYYSENAVWIDNHRIRIPRIIYDIDLDDPFGSEWKIFSEDGQIRLRFKPLGKRIQRMNAMIVKLDFQQLFGEFNGTIIDEKGKKITIKGIRGVSEIHLSHW